MRSLVDTARIVASATRSRRGRQALTAGLLVLTLGLATFLATLTTPATAQTAAGSPTAPGQVNQNTGTFTSSIAIEAPAFHGVEPRLALVYDSSADNGAYGMGWRLSGESVIERVGPGRGSATMTASDTYLLDDEPLVASAALGGTHVTKRQSFVRITFNSAANTWIVREKDGTTKTYAKRLDVATDQTVRWMLSSVADLHGNKVTYGYWCNGTAECYLNTVSYNGTVITLYRETRTDPILTAVGGKVATGGFTKMSYRIKTIDVKVSGSRARAYRLTYTMSATTGRSLLSSVRRFGTNATLDASGAITGGSSLSPISLSYRADTKVFTTKPEFPDWCYASSLFGTGDFNGDGIGDLWCYDWHNGSNMSWVALGNGSGGFTPAPAFQDWCYNKLDFGAGDFNNDGKDDLWCHGTSSGMVEYAIGNGSGGFTAMPANTLPFNFCPVRDGSRMIGDFGTGIFGADNHEGFWCHLRGFWTSTVLPQKLTLYSPCGMTSPFGSGDFDGDGKTEFWCFAPGGTTGPHVALSEKATNDGAISTVPTGAKWCAAGADVGTGDFNGDGRMDIWCRVKTTGSTQVFLSDGTFRFRVAHSLTGWCASTTAQFGVGDFNGDGKDDLWCHDPATAKTWVATSNAGSSGFTASTMTMTSWCGSTARVGVSDFNGDGKSDFWCHSSTGAGRSTWLATSGTLGSGDVLTNVTNEMGGQTQITYKPMTSWPTGAIESGLQAAVGPLLTVSRVRVGDGRGLWTDTSYAYQAGRWDPAERRFLGFKTVTATDSSGAKSVTAFAVAAGYQTGRMMKVQRFSAAGVLLEQATASYTNTAAGGVFTSVLHSKTHAWCQGVGTCQTTRTDYRTYDTYGNVTDSLFYGDTAVASDDTTVLTTFDYVTGSYLVNRALSVTTLAGLGSTGSRLKRLEFSYSAAGDPIVAKTWLDTTNTMISVSTDYDSYGNKIKAVNESAGVTGYAYDATYHMYPVRECRTDAACDADTCAATGVLCTVRTWNMVLGLPTSHRDANSKTTSWSYDAFGRIKLETRPDTGTTTTTYVNWGNPATQYVQTAISDGTTNDLWSRTYVDGLGRTVKTVSEPDHTVLTVYNAQGQVEKVSNPYTGTATPQYTSFGYDAVGRQVRVTHPDGTAATATYSVLTTAKDTDFGTAKLIQTSCDELGVCRRVGFGGQDNPVVTVEWSGVGVGDGTEYRTRMTYDRLGRPTKTTDAVGNVTSTTWDSLGRKTALTDPDSGSWTYGYDEAGHLTSQKDGAGHTITFQYADPLGRITTRKSGTTVLATYRYDQTGHGAGLGQMTSMTDLSGSTSWSYDSMGRATTTSRTISGTTHTVSQSFDTAGRLASVTYPDNESVSYGYGADGCVTSVGGYVTSATCSPTSTSQTLGNGVVLTQALDPKRGWMTTNTATYGTTVLQNEAYTYFGNGKLKTKTSDDTADQWSYTYDNLGRLTAATNTTNTAFSSSYSFDEVGRMLTGTGIGTMTYPAVDGGHAHAPSKVGTVANTYDGAGNLRGDGTATYTYDTLNQLASTTVGTATTSYAYDGLGTRVKAGATSFVEVGGHLLYQYNATSKTGTKFYYYGDQRVAAKTGSSVLYYVPNHLGGPHLTLNASRAVVSKAVYSPFGKTLSRTGTSADPYRQAGDYLDTATGLYQRGIRDQDADRGWFTTPDPSQHVDVTAPQTLNRYSYALGDPINYVDHTGQSAIFWATVQKLTGAFDPATESITASVNVGNVTLSHTINPNVGNESWGASVKLAQMGIASLTGKTSAEFTKGGTEFDSVSAGVGMKAGVDGLEGKLTSGIKFTFDESGNLVSHTTSTAEVKIMEVIDQTWTLYESGDVVWGEYDPLGPDGVERIGRITPPDVYSQKDYSKAFSDEELAKSAASRANDKAIRQIGKGYWGYGSWGPGAGLSLHGFSYGLGLDSFNVWGTSFGTFGPTGFVDILPIVHRWR